MTILTTLREPRLLGFVIFDHILTIIAAYVISRYSEIPLWKVILVLILTSIGLHWILGINTMTNYYLYISDKPQSVNDVPLDIKE